MQSTRFLGRLCRAAWLGIALATTFDAATGGARAQQAQPAPRAQPAKDAVGLTLPEIERHWGKLTPRQQFAVIEQLLRTDESETAGRLLASTEYQSPNDQLVKSFYVALIAKSQRRFSEAIGTMRQLLAEHPQFDRVRLELAHTLFIADEHESARHHFEMLLGSSAQNAEFGALARNFISAMDGQRRWTFSSYATLAPSSNVNQGTATRTVVVDGLPFEVDERNVKKSGVGLVVGAHGGYRQPLVDRLDLIATAGANLKYYRDNEFNDAIVDLALGPRYRFDWGTVGLHTLGSQRWIGTESFYSSLGGLVSSAFQLGRRDIAFADFTCSHRWFTRDFSGKDLTYQDGNSCNVAGRWQHYFDATRYTMLLGGVGLERTGLKSLDNDNWNLGGGYYHELPWGLSAYVQSMFTKQDFDGPVFGASRGRIDERFDETINLTKRDWQIFDMAPMIQYAYTYNRSNVVFHHYQSHGANLTLTKHF